MIRSGILPRVNRPDTRTDDRPTTDSVQETYVHESSAPESSAPETEEAGVDTRARIRAGAVCLAVVAGVSAVLAWLLYAQVTSTCSGTGCLGASGGFLIVGVLAAALALPAFVEPAAIVVAERPGGRRRLRVAGWTALASLGWTALWMGLVHRAAGVLPGSDSPVLQAVTIALVALVAAVVVLVPLLGRRRAAVEVARVVFVLLTIWAIWRFGTLGG
jgi:hypothetical protein